MSFLFLIYSLTLIKHMRTGIMDFLSLTLKLGSFLIILPYLSGVESTTATISMPQYSTQNSEIKVKCEFTATQLLKMLLHYGNSKAEAYYSFNDGKYVIDPTPELTLEIGPGTSPQGGSFTFVFSRIACDKFTTYQCEAVDKTYAQSSSNRTLQALPSVESIRQTSGSIPTVNELSSFRCRGTVRKEGPFSVEWYRNTITLSNRLQGLEAQVAGNNQCGRMVSSILRYNISQYDAPNLVLWCRIVAQQNVDKSANFTIQEMSTIAAPVSPEPVKAGLDPGSIVGIVLGITATIVLIVLLVWFLVVRPKRRAEAASKEQGPEPHAKDYQVQDNILYATVDPSKKQNHKSSYPVDGPDNDSNSVQDTGTAARKQKSQKRNAFLPSHGDATDNMDEAYELPPPPPPPPKPHHSPHMEGTDPLHYAELELAVQKSAKRRSAYGQRPKTDYAVITHS